MRLLEPAGTTGGHSLESLPAPCSWPLRAPAPALFRTAAPAERARLFRDAHVEGPRQDRLALQLELDRSAEPVTAEAEALNAQGIAAYEGERFDEAIALFRRAVALDPSNATFHCNLAVAYGELRLDQPVQDGSKARLTLRRRLLAP